jgi:low temperature requirement protein LtrA
MRALLETIHLPARDPHEPSRVATQLELFFDLVTVIAIAGVTAAFHHALSDGHGIEALPRFLFLFTAIWWAWMNFTWFASAFGSDGPAYRLIVMLIMTGELIFAGGAAQIFKTLDFQWAIGGWCLMRIGMTLLWLKASANPGYATTCRRYAGGIVIAQLCWIAMYFLTEPASAAFYAAGLLCFLIEFAVPPFAESARITPFHRHHIIERYGLLAIISLGEIMLSISLGFGKMYGEDPHLSAGASALAAVVIVFALFWVYFCEREHLVASHFWTAFAWGYGHVFIFGGIAATGAALAAEIDIVDGHSKLDGGAIAVWLGVPLAVVLLALWLTRDRHLPLGWRHPALPVMAAVALLAGLLGQSIWVFALIMIAALVWRVPLSGVSTTDAR